MFPPKACQKGQYTILQKHNYPSYNANKVHSSFWLQHVFIQEMTFDELKVAVRECQLPILLVLQLHICSDHRSISKC